MRSRAAYGLSTFPGYVGQRFVAHTLDKAQLAGLKATCDALGLEPYLPTQTAAESGARCAVHGCTAAQVSALEAACGQLQIRPQ